MGLGAIDVLNTIWLLKQNIQAQVYFCVYHFGIIVTLDVISYELQIYFTFDSKDI